MLVLQDHLGFGWGTLAMSRDWFLPCFSLSLQFEWHHFGVPLVSQQLRCRLHLEYHIMHTEMDLPQSKESTLVSDQL